MKASAVKNAEDALLIDIEEIKTENINTQQLFQNSERIDV